MQSLARYLVEIARPATGWEALQQATARARSAAEQMQAEGTAVRFMRSVFAPEDDVCFFVYEAPSTEAVEEVVRRAELSLERVVRATPGPVRGLTSEGGRNR